MFNFFKGNVHHIHFNNHSILVTNNFFGIEIYTSYIWNLNEEISLYIHPHYSSDNVITFYGFKTLNHMKFFQLLISVPGLGPKTSIKLIANLNYKGVAEAIIKKDIKLITKIPGIGTKIATRIVNDLNDKIPEDFIDNNKSDENDHTYDLLSALINIGYDKGDILNYIPQVNKSLCFEEQLREIILLLSKK
jgi:Holliday junction DNA helicase RuvA